MDDNDFGIKSEPMTDSEGTSAESMREPLKLSESVSCDEGAESDSLEEEDSQSFVEKRQVITHLLNVSEGQEGDYWNLIPNQFLSSFLNSDIASFKLLKQEIGPVNTEKLVDSSGLLYMTEDDESRCVCVHPKVFQYLSQWFGLEGVPIARALIIDASGNKIVEKYPPYFVLHTLGKSTKVYNSHNSKPQSVSLSKISTFQDLLDTVKRYVLKNTKGEFRVWFLNGDNLDDLPSTITLQEFVDIPSKSVVFKNILGDTLKHHSVNMLKYHLLLEVQDKTGNFPVSQYVHNINVEVFDPQNSLSSGGHSGLINLGNTCYMNSALQCLVHVPEINYYFFFDLFMKELNKTNPLGYNGNMAQSFGSLLHKLFSDQSVNGTSLNALSPREFKYTIGHYSSMFQGYQQQDSQEFLSWLLDSLHEDLNRIHDKPYLEKPELKDEDIDNPEAIKRLADISWDQYKKRNDSVIVDLFSGLYQSVLVCPDCGKTSITYDPFNDLTLPLPIEKKWYHTFTVVNLDFNQQVPDRIMKLQIELNKTSNYEELLSYLTRFLNVPKDFLFLYEIFNDYVYQDFQSNNKKYKFIPISELIGANDNVLIYIIPHSSVDKVVPVFNILPDQDKSYNIANVFGVPLFITLTDEEAKSFGRIRGKLEQAIQLLTTVDINSQYRQLKTVHKQFYSKKDFALEPVEVEVDEGYDSDVSLGDPEISADFGFTIKFLDDPRFRPDPRKKVHFPHIKPTLTGLPKLGEKLPELKYNYYHYPNYKRQEDYVLVKYEAKDEENEDKVQSNEEEVQLDEENEVEVDEEEVTPTSSEGAANDESEPLDSSSESSENDRLGSLFDSVSTLNNKTKEELRFNIEKHNHPTFVGPNTLLVCEWDSQIHEQLFNANTRTWEILKEIPNPELEANKAKLIAKQKSTISLYDCLDKFYQPEVLGDQDLWYCPRCKDHKQATKTIKIWNTGDILTIHLKRFQVARSFSDKIDVTVDFPIEGLDMSQYVNSPDRELTYDLIAVDNHYGGLGGGHYTGSALNFRDNRWYYFDDSRVSPIEDPKKVITSAAYLLFYRKRTKDNLLGGEKFSQLIEEGKKQYETNLNILKNNFLQLETQVENYDQDEKVQQPEKEGTPMADIEVENFNSGKKSRSPLMEDDSTFDTKKRLLSKDKDKGSSESE
ncbi:ubiquitin C-terminal hydrolase [Yamadazyma tenuis]|uniref:ubiquitinyl hydrolase 1 n=1 Tax=Candida tenuis (strain ATCC 10573 / BCRC 21748 / CBS 615 / JCM 9827 / NBRC 10315 / NRRL Y-1498 / VKM Y-70) TaxID=590646 RepID=G3AX53_CANTC|nr:uncharacterized protein CANTEDRAFT_117870 [Yamadazyma tenuis ATCC 10573]EGV66692.1 hypothetical protein CANTEDRAFT_117870 [Yamadazyma tenuis ATCC 10573]WEJ95177.1 ubiquitin C-terminal hydrolase [Yamadazyma tenuis]